MTQPIYPSHYQYGALLVATAITPLHPGTGRGYGVVDLPIQRDALGYPEIWASSLKGALKSHLLRVFNSNAKVKNAVLGFFGSEPEEVPSVPGVAMIHNLVPLALPIPSITHGFLYVTTPYLLARIKSYIEIVEQYPAKLSIIKDKLFREIKTIVNKALHLSRELEINQVVALGITDERIALGTMEFIVKNIKRSEISNEETSESVIDALHPLYSINSIRKNLVVVYDKLGRSVIESAIQRVQRVRLDRSTRTVIRGALWSEEYLPTGTLFVGLITWVSPETVINRIEKTITSKSDERNEELRKLLNFYQALSKNNTLSTIIDSINNNYVIVGGKETIGKGILKLVFTSSKSKTKE